jgi:hypothetical protein
LGIAVSMLYTSKSSVTGIEQLVMILQDYTTYNGDVGSEGYSEHNATSWSLVHEHIKNYTASHAERQ